MYIVHLSILVVELAVLGWQLDFIILEVFSNLVDSVIFLEYSKVIHIEYLNRLFVFKVYSKLTRGN